MGVPVAATSVGGPAEILADGVGGRVVRGRDPAMWADAVQELAAWPPPRRAAARDAVAAGYSRDQHVAAALAVYEAVIAASPPPSERE